jgi:methionine--tRNA ligase
MEETCKNVYITTPIYYVNDVAHIGHAYTTIIADMLARYSRLAGSKTFFLTGTDEHGQKIAQSAQERGKTPKEYADEVSGKFKTLWDDFDISYDKFIRTTDEEHKLGVQRAFETMHDKGDIYKGEYEGFYCVSCETFFTEKQLIDEQFCPDCGKPTNIVKEESYFFKLSAYEDKLLTWYEENEDCILPRSKKNEIVNFVKGGLKDLSISRTSFDWGVKLPASLNEPKHVMYVWLDALMNYITALGYGTDEKNMEYWPANVHLVGKDILRFHAIYWPAFLMSLDLPLPKHIAAHGWWTRDGDKMSKSKGNVVAPDKVLKQYGSEILRLWVAMSDYQSDLKISDNILKQMAEQYRKIRNTARFLLANINDLETLVDVKDFGILDKWIISKAKKVFDEIDAAFKIYEFSKGLNKLNNFLVVDLSGVYLDICKDRLYCDNKNDIHRTAAQTAMALIAKKLLLVLAPILTYTVDELLEHSPKILKDDVSDVFDLVKFDLPEVESKLNEENLIKVKEKFSESVDKLKKDKIIKSTLELDIYTNSSEVLSLPSIEAEDWFLVSAILDSKQESPLVSFEMDGMIFEAYKAKSAKCPRCWKFKSQSEEKLCARCDEVLG